MTKLLTFTANYCIFVVFFACMIACIPLLLIIPMIATDIRKDMCNGLWWNDEAEKGKST